MNYKKYKLEDICIKVTDGSHFSPKDDKNSSIPMLSVKDMKEYDFDYSNVKHISDDVYEKLLKSDCVPQKGDVLIAKDGSYFKEVFVNKEFTKKGILSSIAIFRPDLNIILPEYLVYLFKTPEVYNYVKKSCVSGAALPRIILNEFKKIELNIPDIDYQKKVINIIDTIDQKIILNNKNNNDLHDLLEKLFFEVYKTGTKCKLSDLISSITTGSRPRGGAQVNGVPSIGAEKIEKFGIYNYDNEKYISNEFFNKMKNGIVKSGDVLLYKDGAYTGKVSMALNNYPYEKCAVNEHVYILRTNNNYAQNYLYFCLYLEENKNKIHTLASGKAAQPGLNQTELNSVDIKMPSLELIRKFEKESNPLMEKICLNALENRKLVGLKNNILSKLMNGEIDLNNIEL